MSRFERWLLGAANLLVGGTGVVYAVMRYLLESSDPYAVVNHPWQPFVRDLHILLAPVLVFVVGLVWHRHVWAGWRSRLPARRPSGLVLGMMLLPMVVSGYLIQVAVEDAWRLVWVTVHCASSALWLVAYGGHWLGSMVRRLRHPGRRSGVERARWAALFLLGFCLLLWASLARGSRGETAASRASPDGSALVERCLGMMGTTLRIAVEAERRDTALRASERAVRVLEAAEARLSTWRSDSELARLNRSPVGEPMELSKELAEDLGATRRWWQATGGAFDPAIGALARAWGLRSGGRLPSGDELSAARNASGLEKLDLAAGKAIRRTSGLIIDEGGFGKGAALDRALVALAADGVLSAVIDLGGQLAILGAGAEVLCAIADPRARQRPVILLHVDRGSVATSGNSERGFDLGGRRHGHILDPRTGGPAPDFGSVTVWAEASALAADCLATGLYVLGPDSALAWAATEPAIEAVILEPTAGGLRARATEGLKGRVTALSAEISIEYAPSGEDGGAALTGAAADRRVDRWQLDAGIQSPFCHPLKRFK